MGSCGGSSYFPSLRPINNRSIPSFLEYTKYVEFVVSTMSKKGEHHRVNHFYRFGLNSDTSKIIESVFSIECLSMVDIDPVPLLCGPRQLDNLDEQAAQIRRELDGRLQMADQIARVTTSNK
jgi:hypothetical protein